MVDLVDELDHGGDRRVELEAPEDVVGDLGDRLVRAPDERAVGGRLGRAALGDLEAQPPQAAEEAGHALDARVLPLDVVLGRAHVEDVEANRVGAVGGDHLVGRDDVALRLGHLRAEVVDHPLREEAQERLAEAEQPQVVQHLHEEARVEQVQDGVLDAADVLVDGQPVVGDLPVPRASSLRASQ